MKTYIVKPYGICFGVKTAIDESLQTKKDNPNTNVTILGAIVHNEHIVKKMDNANISTVNLKDPINELSTIEPGILIFSAHGHDKKIENKAIELGFKIKDCTCPKVTTTFIAIKKALLENRPIIYIGKKGHPECEAALSISDKIHLFESEDNFDFSKLESNDPIVINQTTYSMLDLFDYHKFIKFNCPNATFINEICAETRMRQSGVMNIPNDCDLIYIVGSNTSSNVNRLYEIAELTKPQS